MDQEAEAPRIQTPNDRPESEGAPGSEQDGNSPYYPRIHIKSFAFEQEPHSDMGSACSLSPTAKTEVNKHVVPAEQPAGAVHMQPDDQGKTQRSVQKNDDRPSENSGGSEMKRAGVETTRPSRAAKYRTASPTPSTKGHNRGTGATRGRPRKYPVASSPSAAEARITKRPYGASNSMQQHHTDRHVVPASEAPQPETPTDIVLCACGNVIDFGPMIQCSRCKGWSHKVCTGLSDAEWEQLQMQHARYQCWLCAPRNARPNSIAADAVQALASVRTGSKWNTIMGRIIESAAMENAEIVGMPLSKPRKHRMVENIMTGTGPGRTHRSSGPRVASTEGSVPLVRDSAKENEFFEALAAHWQRKTGQPWQTPMFRGKLLDLYALYWGVKARGGIDAVIASKRWPEIWRTMRNYYRESTDHSFRLRVASQQYLADFLRQYAGPQPWDVEVLHSEENADEAVTQQKKRAPSDLVPAGYKASRRERVVTTEEFVKPELALPSSDPGQTSAKKSETNGPRSARSPAGSAVRKASDAVKPAPPQSDDDELSLG